MKRFVLLLLLLLPGLMCLARKEKDVVVRHKDAQGREIALAGTLTPPLRAKAMRIIPAVPHTPKEVPRA